MCGVINTISLVATRLYLFLIDDDVESNLKIKTSSRSAGFQTQQKQVGSKPHTLHLHTTPTTEEAEESEAEDEERDVL